MSVFRAGTGALGSIQGVLKWVFYFLVFSISHGQNLLYTSNQNTKFLHGMADAGIGYLARDWLVHTVDPLPGFSFLIYIVFGFLHEYVIYLLFFALLCVYLYGMMGIADRIFGIRESFAKEFAFFGLFAFVHSAFLGTYSILLIEGVADQYLLKEYFQPCVFGVLAILSLYLFLEKKYVRATLLLCAISWFHTAYLFPAALFVCSFMTVVFLETRALRRPAAIGILALTCVLPIILYNLIALAPEGGTAHTRALEILVNERIPHHSLIARWLNWTVIVKVSMICAALWLVRSNRPLFTAVLIPFAGGMLFTLVQAATGSLSLALLAPWRISAFLVPLAAMIILARLIDALPWDRKLVPRTMIPVIALLIIVIICSGVWREIESVNVARHVPAAPVMENVRRTGCPGDTYLIPNCDDQFDKFRLYTGMPIFVNWKSHPYRDGEILEWRRRNTLADAFYRDGNRSDHLLDELAKEGVTHLVVSRADAVPVSPGLFLVYGDEHFSIFRIRNNRSAGLPVNGVSIPGLQP